MDNASLIEQCSAGSREAMESLYCRYSMRMMRVIRRYVNDTKNSEDILHDGFVLIFTHISEVRQPERLEFWMGTIMKNLCLNYLSNLDVMTMLDEEIELPEIPELEDIISYEELEQLINRLPDGYRTVFKLAVLEGKSHKEIGRLLGISPNSSSSQLFHAKVLLRKLIIEHKKQAGLIILSLLIALGAYITLYRRNISVVSSDIAAVENFPIPDEADELIAEAVEPEHAVSGRGLKSVVGVERPDAFVSTDTLSTSTITIISEPETNETPTVVATDTVEVMPKEKRKEMNRRHTYADIPRNAIAKADWTIGVHYTIGSQTPSIVGDMVGAPLYDDYVFDQNIMQPTPDPVFPPSFYSEIDYDIPLTFGVSVAKRLSSRMSVVTGINYTYMRADVKYVSLKVSQIVKSNFVGIPVKLDYMLYNRSKFSFYVSAGASVDFPVGKSVRTHGTPSYPKPVELPDLKSKTEISINGGLGFQYSLSSNVGLYIEPSLRHFFNNNASAPSYWQEHRTLISIPIGLKINW